MATTVDSGSVELPARREFKPKLRTKSQLEQELDVYQSGHNGFKKVRSMSTHKDRLGIRLEGKIEPIKPPRRRLSHDEQTRPNEYRVYVDSTYLWLEEYEDTDKNGQITIEDIGPKVLNLGSATSNGFLQRDIRGTYALSNLYQELTFAKEMGLEVIKISDERLFESPLTRLRRLITERFWPNLLRTTDGSSIRIAASDPKAERFEDQRPRIYIPIGVPEQIEYYTNLAKEHPDWELDVCVLPKNITPEFVKSLNEKPGLLALAMKEAERDGKKTLIGEPFVVPGGRFNELYGWDSYFMALGLLEDGVVELAKSMVINFCFEIEHYGKILNANRSYYLCRSQPPFLTDMALRVYEKIKGEPDAKEFLRMAFSAAIKEYFTVWTAEPRLDPVSGLSRYRPDGLGIPPETEASHFESILLPYAKKHGISVDEFHQKYDDGELLEPELDEYFMHDRAVRESGHDTTYRLDGVCANLATVDLNSLLFKYEKDIEHVIHTHFNDKFALPAEVRAAARNIDPTGKENRVNPESSVFWTRRKQTRQRLIRKYLWCSKRNAYFDYDTVKKETTEYWSATAFWPLWAGLCKPGEATGIILNVLPRLEEAGGLVSGNKESRGDVGIDRPNRQWDFPYGWAPHQILAWQGLTDYGYHDEARRLKVKWMALMLKSFVDFHGVVVEKYDVTNIVDPHRVDAEYGNQGADIRGAAKEGFGWVNASFQIAYNSLDLISKRFLDNLATVAQINEQFSEMMETYAEASFVQEEAVEGAEGSE